MSLRALPHLHSADELPALRLPGDSGEMTSLLEDGPDEWRGGTRRERREKKKR